MIPAPQPPPIVPSVSPDDIDIEGMEVIKQEDVNVVRQIIHLTSQEKLEPALFQMLGWMRTGKFTGHLKLQLVMGGVKRIETEQDVK